MDHPVGIAGDRDQGTHRGRQRRVRRGGGGIGGQITVLGSGVVQAQAAGGDLIGASIDRRTIVVGRGHCDGLIEIDRVRSKIGIDAIAPIGQYADAADDGARLVQREASRVCRKTQRRTLRSDRCSAAGGGHHQVRAGKLTELNAKQWAARRPRRARIKVLLHDLTGRSRRERIALGGQIRSGDRLGDGREPIDIHGSASHGQLKTLESGIHDCLAVAHQAGDQHGMVGGSAHAIHGEHVAHTIDHGDRGLEPASLGFGDALGNDRLDIGNAEQGARRCAAAGAAGVRRCAGRWHCGPAAAARNQGSARQSC